MEAIAEQFEELVKLLTNQIELYRGDPEEERRVETLESARAKAQQASAIVRDHLAARS